MQMRGESPEVFYPGQDPVIVDANDVERLKQAAQSSPRQRARLCTHSVPSDKLHEMLIALPHGAYVRPHKHVGKSESFTIFEGEADLILFNDNGDVRQVIPMGSPLAGKPFYYRTSQEVYHTLIIRSSMLVFHEVTDGPFRREQTVFPAWAPDGSDEVSACHFNARLTSLAS